MSEYESILTKAWNEIPEPKPLPVGTWELKFANASAKEGQEGKSDSVLFVYVPVAPGDDVDDDALAELGENYDFSSNRVYHRFWVSDNRDYAALKTHCRKHGVEPDDYDNLGDALKDLKGTSVSAYLKQRSYVNGANESVIDNTPSNFAAV